MKFQNGCYFVYGGDNSFETNKLGKSLKIDFSRSEGAGVALRKGAEIDKYPANMILSVENEYDTPITILVEKKFKNAQEYHADKFELEPKEKFSTVVNIDAYEKKHMTELVVCMRRPENQKVDKGSIKVKAERKKLLGLI